MSILIGLDVAVLPPPDVQQRALALSAALPPSESKGLRLDVHHLPHITLIQQYVRASELKGVFERIGEVLRGRRPLRLHVAGGGQGASSVWMAVTRTNELQDLHQHLMESLAEFEQDGGTPEAFLDGNARPEDLRWVEGYRRHSALARFTPHITLGHASRPPLVEPFEFDAAVVAACHLGRFCTCRRVLADWTLA